MCGQDWLNSALRHCTRYNVNHIGPSTFQTMVTDTLSTLGTFMMLHMLLPKWDVTRGLFILSAIAFIPSLLNSFNNPANKATATKVIDIIATVIQGSALFIWIITSGADEVKLYDGNGTPLKGKGPYVTNQSTKNTPKYK